MTEQQILDNAKTDKGFRLLVVNVYRHGSSDCTMNGISSKAESLLLICPEGNYSTNDCPDMPICRVQDHPTVKGHQYIVPCDLEGNVDGRWYMFGGNYASGDSRYSQHIAGHPLKIHDRVES